MDQYLKVLFPTRRHVWIDGAPAGWTNRVFQVETGHHVVTLNPSHPNFAPDRHDVLVIGTLPGTPMIVEFIRTDACA